MINAFPVPVRRRTFELGRRTDPTGDVDVSDADAGTLRGFAAGFVFGHDLNELVSEKT